VSGNGLIRQIEQALADLRAIVPEPTPEDAAKDAARAERVLRLSATMSPAHIHAVNETWAAWEHGHRGEPGPERLAAVVHELLDAAGRGRDNFKLALPEPVGALYLAEPDSYPFEQCRACLLVLPLGLGYSRGAEHQPERRFFERCPECGGGVGRWDKWNGGSTLPTPAEKRAT
jgi:hypothetical protein